MKKTLPLISLSFILSVGMYAQIGTGDANALMGLPAATDLAEINAIIGPTIGSIVFNLDDQEIYRFTSTGWQRSTDDQLDSEVNLATPIDVDESGETTPTLETNVQQVIQAIAPITSGAARVFYPPSIEVPVATNGTFTLNLYTQYTAQFSSPTATSPSAPDIPVYAANELHYYVTFADPTVFNTGTMSIDANGVLTYTVIGQPADYNSLINVVFVVK
ncbi:hypothetical protein [Aquimarina macrocephali]|uniref:hypothetical protein n=1 Tax=Aquimarina macrocephali TaxID=666563 RepID=UPI001F4C7E36|nr:hypothetical protein [Aquimarina macrocephali]